MNIHLYTVNTGSFTNVALWVVVDRFSVSKAVPQQQIQHAS